MLKFNGRNYKEIIWEKGPDCEKVVKTWLKAR